MLPSGGSPNMIFPQIADVDHVVFVSSSKVTQSDPLTMSKAKGMHKKPSKKTPLRRKYKIEKKVRDHNKKMRKLAKKNPRKTSKQKPISMPRNAPFSADWDGLTFSGPLDKKRSKTEAAIVSNLAPVMDIENPRIGSTDVRMDDTTDPKSIMEQLNSQIKQKRDSETSQLLKGMQVNKERQKQLKKIKQKKKKIEKVSEKLADSLDLNVSMDQDGDDYDFETDFNWINLF